MLNTHLKIVNKILGCGVIFIVKNLGILKQISNVCVQVNIHVLTIEVNHGPWEKIKSEMESNGYKMSGWIRNQDILFVKEGLDL